MNDTTQVPLAENTKPATKFTAQVAEHTLLAGKYQYVYFELIQPHRLHFDAGQYLLMSIPGGDEKKSYSIASMPDKDHGVEVLVDISPQGDGALYLGSLAPGDTVEFMAPVGQFVIDESNDAKEKEKELVFIATGSGISPVRSMLLDLLETKKDTRPMSLHWGLRYADELFWEEDLRRLDEYYDNFTFDIVLSRPPETWPLCRGRVTDCLRTHGQTWNEKGFYLCGSKAMIEDVKKLLVAKGVDEARIHNEKFY